MSNSALSKISKVNTDQFNNFLLNLIGAGWTFSDCGTTTFLPVGDTDYSWESGPLMDEAKAFDLLHDKIEKKEVFGIAISYKDTNCGGEILYSVEESSISISWAINRLENDSNNLDFDWYIEKIRNAAKTAIPNCLIFSIETDSGGRLITNRQD